MTRWTRAAIAAFSRFSAPRTLVRTASIGKNSHDGTCFKRGGVEHVVDAGHRVLEALLVAHVPDVKLDPGVGPVPAHVVLFLLVTREDPDFGDVAAQVASEHGVAERAGAAGNEKGLSCEHESVRPLATARGGLILSRYPVPQRSPRAPGAAHDGTAVPARRADSHACNRATSQGSVVSTRMYHHAVLLNLLTNGVRATAVAV